MNKTFVLHHLPDIDDLPAAERWFHRLHIPEVLRNRPLRYVSFRAVPAPEGADACGYCNYKVHEDLTPGDEEPPWATRGRSPCRSGGRRRTSAVPAVTARGCRLRRSASPGRATPAPRRHAA